MLWVYITSLFRVGIFLRLSSVGANNEGTGLICFYFGISCISSHSNKIISYNIKVMVNYNNIMVNYNKIMVNYDIITVNYKVNVRSICNLYLANNFIEVTFMVIMFV